MSQARPRLFAGNLVYIVVFGGNSRDFGEFSGISPTRKKRSRAERSCYFSKTLSVAYGRKPGPSCGAIVANGAGFPIPGIGAGRFYIALRHQAVVSMLRN